MVIVVAALEFGSEEDRDQAVALTADVQRLTREDESGCLDYCFAPDPAIPTRMQVYERWETSESLAAHFDHPYYERMAGLLRGVGIVSSTNQAYLIERGEGVYTDAGEKKTAFFVDPI
jgi:quinol monooxygenase YgiN